MRASHARGTRHGSKIISSTISKTPPEYARSKCQRQRHVAARVRHSRRQLAGHQVRGLYCYRQHIRALNDATDYDVLLTTRKPSKHTRRAHIGPKQHVYDTERVSAIFTRKL